MSQEANNLRHFSLIIQFERIVFLRHWIYVTPCKMSIVLRNLRRRIGRNSALFWSGYQNHPTFCTHGWQVLTVHPCTTLYLSTYIFENFELWKHAYDRSSKTIKLPIQTAFSDSFRTLWNTCIWWWRKVTHSPIYNFDKIGCPLPLSIQVQSHRE